MEQTDAAPELFARPPRAVPLIYRRWMVFLLLFVALGAVGIPVLVKSPCFSRGEKWFWSIVVGLYTTLLLVLTVWIVVLMIAHLQEAIALMQ